jgi:hypothetical protein
MRLTAQALAKHRPPDKSDYIVFDDDIAGFGLRFREGRRSWVFQYAIGSGAGRITRRVGDYPALSPAKAREEAANLHAKVHLHGDPASLEAPVPHRGFSFCTAAISRRD